MIYQGEVLDGKLDGRAMIQYKNGDVYQGYMKDNKRYGRGSFYYFWGDVYTGDIDTSTILKDGTYI